MESKMTHFLYTPFTGLGLYGGHRGARWLKNRIKIFKQFVVPSLLSQTSKNFVLWVSWRHEDVGNKHVLELKKYLDAMPFRVVFTYTGVCFWDDKYPDTIARDRLVGAVHGALGALHNFIGESDEVLMTIQPSDDCYHSRMVEETQLFFNANKDTNVFGYQYGYVMDYTKLKLAEWNPKTTPPFYTIRFNRKQFTDPRLHLEYTGPYKSHEYVKDFLKAHYDTTIRGFLVGTHGENISTIFNHPFRGNDVSGVTLGRFGLGAVQPLKLKLSLRKWVMRKLPYGWQRKCRYWFGERGYARFYNWMRS